MLIKHTHTHTHTHIYIYIYIYIYICVCVCVSVCVRFRSHLPGQTILFEVSHLCLTKISHLCLLLSLFAAAKIQMEQMNLNNSTPQHSPIRKYTRQTFLPQNNSSVPRSTIYRTIVIDIEQRKKIIHSDHQQPL